MIGWGVALIIIGAGSLLLPMFNYQFTLMELVDDYQPYAGIVVAVIGAALVLLGMNRRPDTTVVESRQPQASSPADAAPTPTSDGVDRQP
jgi:protein-S-isoprenylcysteine O-methyltransferase Ste14